MLDRIFCGTETSSDNLIANHSADFGLPWRLRTHQARNRNVNESRCATESDVDIVVFLRIMKRLYEAKQLIFGTRTPYNH
jgi:hypothetical protein